MLGHQLEDLTLNIKILNIKMLATPALLGGHAVQHSADCALLSRSIKTQRFPAVIFEYAIICSIVLLLLLIVKH